MSLNTKVFGTFMSFVMVWMVVFGISDHLVVDARIPFRIVYTFISSILMLYVIGLITTKHIHRINKILLEECDPEKYLSAIYDTLLTGRNKRKSVYFLTIMIYSGLYEAGRYEQALTRLQILNIIKIKNTRQAFAYYSKLSEVNIALGRLDDAQKALDQCFSIIGKLTDPRLWQRLNKTYIKSDKMLKMAQGCYDGAEPVFEAAFTEAKHEHSRVHAKYWLGFLYQNTGKAEKAREAFKYVAAHGNQLHFAELAREQLGLEPQPSVARLWKQETVRVP